MKAKDRRWYDQNRKRRHIDRHSLGYDCRTYIPQWRMRQIRWEESIAHSIAKRKNETNYKIGHSTCSCGSLGCLGIPIRREIA